MCNLKFNLGLRAIVLAALLVVATGGAVFGQATGNVYVDVVDTEGSVLPGVTVTLSQMGAPRIQVTNAQGQVRFLGLDPGAYALRSELEGFSTVEYPSVQVRTGRNTSLEVTVQAAVAEVITVTSESPLLDERKLAAGTTVTQVELEKIPTARDPWALMSQTPGVMVDRINVGGSESGQQAIFRAQGVASDENDFMVDGIQITDMGAIGASPTYYDFDQFAEISFTTGGSDVSKNSSGLQVNMVTKRGTNEFRGSARFYKTQAKGYFGGYLDQSDLDVSSEICTSGCANDQDPDDYAGAQINEISDLGFEAGGPALRDRVWLWGSWGKNDIKTFASSGDPDDTVLENTSIKLNAQFTSANSFITSYNNGDKIKAGRGAGPTRSPESLWDQRGPSAISRFEDTHVFSSNFFLTGTFSIVDLGFALLSRGPSTVADGLAPDAPDPTFDSDGVWQDNFLSGSSSRPGTEFKLDGSYFFDTGNMNHELKAGGRLRTVEGSSLFSWGPRNVFHTYWGTDVARHSSNGPSTNEYLSFWAQDTMTFGNFTINVGFRFDDQSGVTDPTVIAPHAVFPELLPGFAVPAGASDITWTTITPRIGVTYALGEERKTLLRGSFSQFADQMSVGIGNWTSPTYYGWYAYIYEGDLYAASYFDPLNPSVSPNTFESGFDAPITSELLIGAEHAFLPEFMVGAQFTYRNIEDIADWMQMIRDGSGGQRVATPADYELVGFESGTIPRGGPSYNIPIFDLIGQLSPFDSSAGAPSGGRQYTNGPRTREYMGFSVNFTKRLANQWMARGYINYGDAEWQDVPAGYIGCGPAGGPNNQRGGGCENGDLFVERTTGSGKGERFLQSTWSFNLNGMYQIAPDRPWGFNFSANINGREGHPITYYGRFGTTLGATNMNIVEDFNDFRLPDPITADLRIEKEFAPGGPVGFTFGIDVFNVTNNNDGLSYQARNDVGSAGWLQDNVSPRIWRLGVRMNWR